MNPAGQNRAVLAVAERLHRASIDQIVTYSDLSQAAGCDILEKRWIALQAIRRLNRDYGLVFRAEKRIGYRRLGGAEGVRCVGEKSLSRCRNAARSGQRRLESAMHHANDLSAEDVRQAHSRLCALGLIHHLSLSRTIKALPDSPPPPPDGLAELRRALGT